MFYVHAQMSEDAQYVLLACCLCCVHIPIIIINFKLRDAEQNSVPYMMKVVITPIPIECGVVDPYIYRFLAKPWSSLPMMVKLSGLVLCPEMLLCQ